MEYNIDSDDTEENNDWISAGADYSPKAEFKMAILAMDAVKVCLDSRAKEMKQGFWNNKIDKHGNAVRVWVEDQRKVFINSVIALQNLLSAECLNDDIYKTFKKKSDEDIKKIFLKYAYRSFEFDPESTGWKKTQHEYMPQIDQEVLIHSPQDPSVLVNVEGGWNDKVNSYYDELVFKYDDVFKELRNVIYRTKDFKKKMVIG